MDNYKQIKLIGKGSYGSVFQIQKKSNQKIYALKKIKSPKFHDKYEILNLINELKILCFHNSDYLLKCCDIFYENKYIHIVTNYAKYSDLSVYLNKFKKNKKKILEKNIWLIFIKTCYGIQYLHDNNIIHRDLKPANILLDENSSILISDFGISKIIKNQPFFKTIIGTPYYISPEMYNNIKYDNKIDIWAMGCILFEMATLTVPFHGNNIKSLKKNIINGHFNDDKLNYYSPDLKHMISLMLNKNYYSRPSIHDIIHSPIFKKHEIELNLDYSYKHSNTIVNKLQHNIVLPKYSSEWKDVIQHIDIHNNNKSICTEFQNNKESIIMNKQNNNHLPQLNIKKQIDLPKIIIHKDINKSNKFSNNNYYYNQVYHNPIFKPINSNLNHKRVNHVNNKYNMDIIVDQINKKKINELPQFNAQYYKDKYSKKYNIINGRHLPSII